jgi:hypothetical protein
MLEVVKSDDTCFGTDACGEGFCDYTICDDQKCGLKCNCDFDSYYSTLMSKCTKKVSGECFCENGKCADDRTCICDEDSIFDDEWKNCIKNRFLKLEMESGVKKSKYQQEGTYLFRS